jgi:hypothetical protein
VSRSAYAHRSADLTKPQPRLVPEPDAIPVGFKMKPPPASTYHDKQTLFQRLSLSFQKVRRRQAEPSRGRRPGFRRVSAFVCMCFRRLWFAV